MLCVVSGQVEGAGKTAIISRMIAETSHAGWAAVRIQTRTHPQCLPQDGICWTEEVVANSRTEAGIYLAAGAKRAWSLKLRGASLGPALPYVRRLVAEHENVVVETVSPLPELGAELSLYVTARSEQASLPAPWLAYIDAFVTLDTSHGASSLRGSRPVHVVNPATYSSKALINMLQERLRPHVPPPSKVSILASL